MRQAFIQTCVIFYSEIKERPSAPDSSSGTKGHEILSAVPPKLLLAKPLTYVKGYEPCSFHCQLGKWKDLSFLPVRTKHRLSEKIRNRSFRHRFLLIFCYYSLLYTKKQAHFNALAEVDTCHVHSPCEHDRICHSKSSSTMGIFVGLLHNFMHTKSAK